MSRCVVTILAALLAGFAPAEEVIIDTRDGRSFEGVISLRENVLSVLNAERGVWAEIAVTNLSSALFKPRPPDPFLPQLYAAQAENDAELWTSQDIGWSFTPGNESAFFGLRRTFGTGTNIAGLNDSFHFTHQPIRGNREIIARIIRIPHGPAAKAGLMFRSSLKSDAPNVFIALTAAGGGMFQYREQAPGETVEMQRPDLFVPQWLKLKRQGNRFSAWKSGNGRRWTLIQEMDLAMEDELFAGLAITGTNPNPFGERQFAICDNLQAGFSLPMNPYRPVVHLHSGSAISGRIRDGSEAEISFMGPLPKSPLALPAVSRIDFQWVPYRYVSFLSEARPGVLLANGDFIEGEFKGVQDQHAILSSVLVGVRTYDLNQDVLSVVLRPPARRPYAFEISTTDGSRWLAADLQFGCNELILRETALGTWRLPIYELAEIRRFPYQRFAPSLARR